MDTQEILNLQEAYLNVYSSYELDEEEADRLRDRRAEAGAHVRGGNDPEPRRRPSSDTAKPKTPEKTKQAAKDALASVVASYREKYGSNSIVSGSRTRKPGGSVSEATAMAKRGYDESPIRQKIAKSTGGGEAADRATALEKRPTFGSRDNQAARSKYAQAQRGDFRSTTSSSPGLRGYAFKSDDPTVRAKQAARGAQRSALTPKEKQKLNREEFELYDIVLSHLLDEGYADTVDSAEVIMDNMSEEWVDDILEANRGDQYATRGMEPRQALAKKTSMRDYRNTSGGHLYATAATDERTTRHRGPGHAVPGYQGRGQTSRPTPRNTPTNAQMMRTSPDKSMAKDYVRKQIEAQRTARQDIQRARQGG